MKVCFLFEDKEKFEAAKFTFEDFDLVSFTADRSACAFLNCDQVSNLFKNFQVTCILHIILKESTLLKGNLCIYKCFIDVL